MMNPRAGAPAPAFPRERAGPEASSEEGVGGGGSENELFRTGTGTPATDFCRPAVQSEPGRWREQRME